MAGSSSARHRIANACPQAKVDFPTACRPNVPLQGVPAGCGRGFGQTPRRRPRPHVTGADPISGARAPPAISRSAARYRRAATTIPISIVRRQFYRNFAPQGTTNRDDVTREKSLCRVGGGVTARCTRTGSRNFCRDTSRLEAHSDDVCYVAPVVSARTGKSFEADIVTRPSALAVCRTCGYCQGLQGGEKSGLNVPVRNFRYRQLDTWLQSRRRTQGASSIHPTPQGDRSASISGQSCRARTTRQKSKKSPYGSRIRICSFGV